MLKIYDTNYQDFLDNIFSRNSKNTDDVSKIVREIIQDIKINNDSALFKYIEKFDGAKLNSQNIKVSDDEIKKAYQDVDKDYISLIQKSIERIKFFHQKQLEKSWFDCSKPGEFLGQIVNPLNSVGVYVPGGKAFYPSSVLMNIVPAKVAGVKNIIMVSPSDKNGVLNSFCIVAALEAGVTNIYKVGGAQAVAALAYGTNTIPKVDKITGPGNIYVATAKKEVYGQTGIDSIAGPSEILVIADDFANPAFVAADLLSQAEHDEMASSILICLSKDFANNVNKEIARQTSYLTRKNIITQSLNNYGGILIVDSIEKAFEISNQIAPEHLEVCVNNPFSYLSMVKNAGAVFLGDYSPEPLGDYMAGTNHVLPTSQSAKFFSPLCVEDFMKKTSVIYFDKKSLDNLSDDIIKFANIECLDAHANSIFIRKEV